MSDKNDKLDKYNDNLKKASNSFRSIRKNIKRMWSLVFHILRFLIPLILSPILLIILIIVLIIWWLYMLVAEPWSNIEVKKNPAIVLNKDTVIALWLEVYDDWEYKWEIKWCENLDLPKNIYTSFINWFADNVYKADSKFYDNFCLYHLLYIKKITKWFDLSKDNELLENVNNTISKWKLTSKQKKELELERDKINNKITLVNKAVSDIWFENVWEDKFQNYKSDEYWFKSYVYYPVSFFEANKKSFLDMLYYNHIWVTYGEAYPDWVKLWWSLFWINDDNTYYNILNELWTEFNEDNIATEFLNGKFWFPNFIDDINSQWYYYNFNCEPCTGESCTCTWNPEVDYWRNFRDDNLWLTYFRWYINFINALKAKKVTYVSENVKSPFRDYMQWDKQCKVNISLTQRDWPSWLAFWLFKWYPKVDWVRTHAWLDLATRDNCNWANVPVYSVTDWIVVFKSYSSSSWWNSIIIRTNIHDWTYYVRYSHLKDLPRLSMWQYVDTDTLIWFEWTTWPSSWEHLDLTIYDSWLEYKNYLRDTLNWWWLFNFSFTDMMQNWYSDYTIWSFTDKNCYNCKK
jgi:hypothetical protein